MVSALIMQRLEKMPEPDSMLTTLNRYVAQYPALDGTPIMQASYVISHLTKAVKLFSINQPSKAMESLHRAEAINETIEQLDVPGSMVAAAYGEAWRSYVRLGDYTKARKVVEQGLKLDPYNEALRRYLDHLDKRFVVRVEL